ncbi:hypothetical protein OUZ56_029344 [Daphnia magna]|uniref:Uncharacterized protein n=1 Tax=Daphnia magna TaxID=35525 RepID=A0ABR0B6J7_9CRUS|nr:hypothetical protein OUZ56_029344 [Daphnia magna]
MLAVCASYCIGGCVTVCLALIDRDLEDKPLDWPIRLLRVQTAGELPRVVYNSAAAEVELRQSSGRAQSYT